MTRPPFACVLRPALGARGVVVLADTASAVLYCMGTWHVVAPRDTPGLYRWDGRCTCGPCGAPRVKPVPS